jgi:hypothetical protein
MQIILRKVVGREKPKKNQLKDLGVQVTGWDGVNSTFNPLKTKRICFI